MQLHECFMSANVDGLKHPKEIWENNESFCVYNCPTLEPRSPSS